MHLAGSAFWPARDRAVFPVLSANSKRNHDLPMITRSGTSAVMLPSSFSDLTLREQLCFKVCKVLCLPHGSVLLVQWKRLHHWCVAHILTLSSCHATKLKTSAFIPLWLKRLCFQMQWFLYWNYRKVLHEPGIQLDFSPVLLGMQLAVRGGSAAHLFGRLLLKELLWKKTPLPTLPLTFREHLVDGSGASQEDCGSTLFESVEPLQVKESGLHVWETTLHK